MLQLIYASAATVRFSVADLKHLLAIARANNESLGVSGMLVFQEGSFLQIIEGEDDAVLSLFTKIEKDERHCNINMLLRSQIEERSFGEWQMGFYDVSRSVHKTDAGFVDFFREGHVFDDSDIDRARSVLMRFRDDGAWHERVNIK